jgi:hypothetical protein
VDFRPEPEVLTEAAPVANTLAAAPSNSRP